MELVNNRIDLLSNTQDCHVSVSYDDLIDKNNNSKGLLVEITVPLIFI